MKIEALGYLGVRCPDPRAWVPYGRDVLGMQPFIEPSRHWGVQWPDPRGWLAYGLDALGALGSTDAGGRVRLRMDDRYQRLLVEPGDTSGLAWMGWEVADRAQLAQARAELAASGTPARTGTAGECAARGVSNLIVFADPAGNRIEAFCDPTTADPFVAGRPGLGGFDTSSGLPHLALVVPDLESALAFYERMLGFEECDRITGGVEARFLRINARHHSLVLFEGQRNAIDHLMVEVSDIHDIGAAMDASRSAGFAPTVSLGYHAADDTLSCYLPSPAGFRIEYGVTVAGRQRPPWGHEGLLDAVAATTAPPDLAEAVR